MSVEGITTNIQRCSTEDGPGIRTTVFLKGCPLSCVWCHNIETIDPAPQLVWHSGRCIADLACIKVCPENALSLISDGMKIDRTLCTVCGKCVEVCPTTAMEMVGTEWDVDVLVQELLKDKVFFDTSGGGVTISGGEALFQLDFSVKIAKGLKKEGVHVALDTCGYGSEGTLNKILSVVDMVLYDLKIIDSQRHKNATGVPVERVLDNARIIAAWGKPVWIRTPVIPDYTDDEANIRAIARFIIEHMPNAERYDLLAFNNMCIDKYALFELEYPLREVPLVPEEHMERLAHAAREEGVANVCWSGMTRREDNRSTNIQDQEEESCHG